MYFDLGKFQEHYKYSFDAFIEYLKIREDKITVHQWMQLNIDAELGMKNILIPALEGYLINFFNKHDYKLSIGVNKRGKYLPRLYKFKHGEYRNNFNSAFDLRYDAMNKLIDTAFAQLNVDLIMKHS